MIITLWYVTGIIAATLIAWNFVVKYRRNREHLPRTFARCERTRDAVEITSGNMYMHTTDDDDDDVDVENVMVIGGQGFLGHNITETLLARMGDRVHIHIFDSAVPPPEKRNENITYISGDVKVIGHLERAFNSVNGHLATVFHLASLVPGERNTESAQYDVTVQGTLHVVKALSALGKATKKPSLLVYTSTALVVVGRQTDTLLDADETAPIPKEKLSAWVACKAKAEAIITSAAGPHLQTCILRPTPMFGVGDKSLMDKLVAGKLSFYVGPGDNLVDFVSVEDVAMGHVLAAESILANLCPSEGVYILGSDNPITVKEFMGHTKTYTTGDTTLWGQPLPWHMPTRTGLFLAFVSEVMNDLFAVPMYSQLKEDHVRVLSRNVTFKSTKAKDDFGYTPSEATLKTIERTVRKYKLAQNANMRGLKLLRRHSSKRLSRLRSNGVERRANDSDND